MIKRCEHCQKEFETNFGIKRFCCRSCKEKARKNRVKNNIYFNNINYNKICLNCGKHFITNNLNQKYCSEKCKNKEIYKRNKKEQKEWRESNKEYFKNYEYKCICKNCNKEFINKGFKVKFCAECLEEKKFKKYCKICGKEFIAKSLYIQTCNTCKELKKTKAKKVYTKICPICNKEFKTTNNIKKYCSDECKKININIKARNYRNSLDTREKYKEAQYKYHKKLRKNILYSLKQKISQSIRRCIHSDKNMSSLKYVDYTSKDLKEHLELLFQEGMDWNNYGTVWEIDHIRPLASYNFYNEDGSVNFECLKEANSLNNLQPLFKEENIRKSSWYNNKFYKNGEVVAIKE